MTIFTALALIFGIPRKKKSVHLKLENDLRKRQGVLRVHVKMGVVGLPDSGRKTLAYRLANMHRGAFSEEVPVDIFYTLYRGGSFKEEDPMPHARFFITVNMYIIPEPEMHLRNARSGATQYHRPSFLEHLEEFCCLVLAFDMTDSTTLSLLPLYPSVLHQYNVRVPTCFLVGNKCDLRSELPPIDTQAHPSPVPQQTAYRFAEYLEATYFELSAKYNINVRPLYARILEIAAAQR